MKIKTLDIKYYFYSKFTMCANDKLIHTKSSPYLSIVQSKIGSYGIKLNDGPTYQTGEGNFFIAPSLDTQEISHHLNPNQSLFKARYIFLDIIINQKYQFDEVFDMPVVLDQNANETFDADFDEFERADDICEKMCCIYKIIKHLIAVSSPKDNYRNNHIHPLIEYIKSNYMDDITVSEMADTLNMSESNLYTIFKKSTGISPIKYLNAYRVSVAATLLLQTDDSIQTIAEKVGIGDPFYFSKLFKKKYMVSPRQYRKERY